MSNLIETLEPQTKALCEAFLAAATAKNYALRVTQALRSLDEQLHLWARGRRLVDGVWQISQPSLIVTKAPPGSSAHNYGAAFDVCWEGSDPYLHQWEVDHQGASDPRWLEIGTLGESLGLSWGGPLGEKDTLTWDRPHFERPDWKTLAS